MSKKGIAPAVPENVSLAFLQRRMEQLKAERGCDREIIDTADDVLHQVRDLLGKVRKCLGRETLDDSLDKYEAFRALEDMEDAIASALPRDTARADVVKLNGEG